MIAPEVLNRMQFQKQLPNMDWDKAAPEDPAVIHRRIHAARRFLGRPYIPNPHQQIPGQQRLF